MLKTTLIVLQVLQVAFLWVHDWLPLGSLNDVRAVRAADSFGRLVLVTLIQSLPFTVILLLCIVYAGRAYPQGLVTALWVAYIALFVGQLRAWWVPYLLRPEPARATRYGAMFGNTHSFLPVRNGLVPNTAHIFLHVCTLATLVVLFVM